MNFSEMCSIPDGDSVLLTGGHCYWGLCYWGKPLQASSKVSRYTREEGWVEDLPDMNQGRYGHGCTAFTMNQEQVRERS